MKKALLSPFSYNEAEKYVLDGQRMLKKRPKPSSKEWAMRTLSTVCFGLNKALPKKAKRYTPTRLTKKFSMLQIQTLFNLMMKMSGLKARPIK